MTARHFNLDPALARIARFRTTGSSGARYFTVRFDHDGRIIGVVIED